MSTLFFFFVVVSHIIGLSREAPIEDWRPPLDDLTALQKTIAPPWVSSPRTRGTFEILYSCSFTLALCAYTAIHLNVPPPKENKLSFYLRKAKWVVIALFGPEVVLYAAWDQWYQARVFCRQFNMCMEKRSKRMKGRRNTTPRVLTLADGFYAVMGGYVIDIRVSILGHPIGRYTLSPDQIISMVKLKGYAFPIVGRETIEDKSKANLLAKFLVCFQVSFLIIQVGCVSSPPGSCC